MDVDAGMRPESELIPAEICECEFIDVLESGPPMRMAMAHCPSHGHPWDCSGCWYCQDRLALPAASSTITLQSSHRSISNTV